MISRHAAAPGYHGARHVARFRRHRLFYATALATTALAAFSVSGIAMAYGRFQGNIDEVNTEALLGDDRPPTAEPDPNDPNAGTPVNILVLGTDTRAGQGAYTHDQVDGQRSDTAIVVHISADRSRVEMVSIPRDSIVDIPSCTRSDGSTSSPTRNKFNAAFALGGMHDVTADAAACSQKTVESLTGVRIDDVVVVNMSGFAGIIDALGGVPMCIEQDIESPKAHLSLSAGYQTLDGATALGYMRARKGQGLGDGSDLMRIGRQQEFIAAVARKTLESNLLADPPTLYQFLDAGTQSLTVSSGLASIPDMAGLAFSLHSIDRGNISFMTIPYGQAPSDINSVVWTSAADDVWAKIAADEPLKEPTAPTAAASADGTTPGTGSTSSADDPEAPDEPAEMETPTPGIDLFTVDDQTSVCE